LIEQTNEELNLTLETVNAQKEELQNQHRIVSHQNKLIKDSISYASWIQQAVLPSQKTLGEIIPNHFVYFKPRDIVSGDFYWVKKIDHYLIVATVDCTGHGVPGALMSMLGISFLNEIIRKNVVPKPNQILEELRAHIKDTLNQTGKKGESKDGMDMSLYQIDIQKNTLLFAGARLPLYLVRNKQLTEFKASKQPIGIYAKEQPFENQEISLESGDILYTFSDGFADQTGGDKKRKFSYGRFKELLLSIHANSMNEQQQILDNNFLNWIGDENDQIDDVLVLGVKV
jgi:serine phosphatase RsbU (regulator of sigma subunit)